MDLSTLAPTASQWTPARAGRKAADKGPNPFVVNGWLQESFDSGEARMVTVEGRFEDLDKTTRKGDPVSRRYVRGEAEEVIKLIRAAGEELKIGVAINPVAGKRRGTITIHYLGQKRKETLPRGDRAQKSAQTD